MTATDRSLVAGDIFLADLDPTRGSEQAGFRPVMIISSALMHTKSKRVIACPITSNMQPWTTKLLLPVGFKTVGMVLTDQVRALDKAERLLRYIETLPVYFVTLVRSYVGRLLDLEIARPSA